MGHVVEKIVFDVAPEIKRRWMELCRREHLTQAEMFRRLISEKGGSDMTQNRSIAVVRETDDGYVVTFHETEAMPAHARQIVASPDVARNRYNGYAWREPREGEAVDGDVVLIGEAW